MGGDSRIIVPLVATWIAGASASVGGAPEAGRGAMPLLAATDSARLMSAAALAALAGLLVLVVLFVAFWAIRRRLRSLREASGRRRAAPTPSDDVWSKHKLPDGWDDDEEEGDDDDQLPVY